MFQNYYNPSVVSYNKVGRYLYAHNSYDILFYIIPVGSQNGKIRFFSGICHQLWCEMISSKTLWLKRSSTFHEGQKLK